MPGSRRSPGEGNGTPLQYSCQGNPMDRGAWQAMVHGVARTGHDLVTKPPSPEHKNRFYLLGGSRVKRSLHKIGDRSCLL